MTDGPILFIYKTNKRKNIGTRLQNNNLKSKKNASFLVEDGGGGEGAVVEGGGQDDRLLGAWLALLEPERSIMYFCSVFKGHSFVSRSYKF